MWIPKALLFTYAMSRMIWINGIINPASLIPAAMFVPHSVRGIPVSRLIFILAMKKKRIKTKTNPSLGILYLLLGWGMGGGILYNKTLLRLNGIKGGYLLCCRTLNRNIYIFAKLHRS
jgi:hypothetical protein